MQKIEWKCPDCGAYNSDTIEHAQTYTCVCTKCKTECEVYFDVVVSEVNKVWQGKTAECHEEGSVNDN
jgi:hypothetical protein